MSKIRFNAQLQCFECQACGEMVEVSRHVLADQHRYVELRDRLEETHKDCTKRVLFYAERRGQEVMVSIPDLDSNRARS